MATPGYKTNSPISSIPESLNLASVGDYVALQYYAIFNIGTPGQSLSLVLDTGSSWVWVPGPKCACHVSTPFNSSASSTYNSTLTRLDLYYGVGEVHGYLGSDFIEIDGKKASQSFVLVDQDYNLDGLQADGLMGLAFSGLSGGHPTFVESLKSQGQISNATFSIYLSNPIDPYLESSFIIGGSDAEQYGIGEMERIDVSTNMGYWLVVVGTIRIDGVAHGSQHIGILDTGTSMLFGPSAQVNAIKDAIIKSVGTCTDDSYLFCTCEGGDLSSFPVIEFVVGEQSFAIQPENYVMDFDGICLVLVESSNDVYWVIGQPFFRQFYTVHDMENEAVFVWNAKTNSNSLSSGVSSERTGVSASATGVIAIGAIALAGYLYRRSRTSELTSPLLHT